VALLQLNSLPRCGVCRYRAVLLQRNWGVRRRRQEQLRVWAVTNSTDMASACHRSACLTDTPAHMILRVCLIHTVAHLQAPRQSRVLRVWVCTVLKEAQCSFSFYWVSTSLRASAYTQIFTLQHGETLRCENIQSQSVTASTVLSCLRAATSVNWPEAVLLATQGCTRFLGINAALYGQRSFCRNLHCRCAWPCEAGHHAAILRLNTRRHSITTHQYQVGLLSGPLVQHAENSI
jgi:hypothetical protein